MRAGPASAPSMPELPILLSIVIPTWNAAELTVTTLEALVPDGVPVWAEVIVVDDGSDDGTAGRISRRFPEIRVLRHARNRGFGAAVNTGFSSATGRFLGTVNNDVSVTWTCLEAIVRFLEEQADGGAASPLIVDAGGICRRVGFDFPGTPWQLVARRLSRRVAARQLTSEVSVAPYAAEYLRGACVVFKRAALEEVGLFDEQFHMFAEEIDLFRRLSHGGWTAWVLPSERATHYEGQTSRNHPDPVTASKFRQQSYRSICIYYSKHHSWFTVSLLRGMLAVRITLRLVRSLVPVSLLGDGKRSPAEHLGALANVVGRCPSRPRERSLPVVPG